MNYTIWCLSQQGRSSWGAFILILISPRGCGRRFCKRLYSNDRSSVFSSSLTQAKHPPALASLPAPLETRGGGGSMRDSCNLNVRGKLICSLMDKGWCNTNQRRHHMILVSRTRVRVLVYCVTATGAPTSFLIRNGRARGRGRKIPTENRNGETSWGARARHI